jgi:UDP-N-acetylmuramoyl-tripeptide--D-alanyl-D-alanine ligase
MDESLFQVFYSTSGICTDTRSIEKDCLFVCINGVNFDGNSFALGAIEAGAKHVIVDNPDYLVENANMTLVPDSIVYLQQLANYHRRKFEIPVIGITGSNGKTTTKELINSVLSAKYNVLATIGNLNNHIGVPLTLLRLSEKHDIAIIEMGANKFKDIEELCLIAEPTHGIITNIGKAHLEGFLNFEGVLATKRELYTSVYDNNGIVFINMDDEVLTKALPNGISTFPYGTSNTTIVHGELIGLSPYVEMKLNNGKRVLQTQMIGKYNFYNYLAAAAFGVYFDVSLEQIGDAIESYTPTNNRSQVKKTPRNTLILDCYNANPSSMQSAIESFSMNNHPHKLLILGDMKELGTESMDEHKKVILQMEHLGLEGIVVGSEFGTIESRAIINSFNTVDDLINELSNEEELNNYLILLKGSRSMRLEVLESVL